MDSRQPLWKGPKGLVLGLAVKGGWKGVRVACPKRRVGYQPLSDVRTPEGPTPGVVRILLHPH